MVTSVTVKYSPDAEKTYDYLVPAGYPPLSPGDVVPHTVRGRRRWVTVESVNEGRGRARYPLDTFPYMSTRDLENMIRGKTATVSHENEGPEARVKRLEARLESDKAMLERHLEEASRTRLRIAKVRQELREARLEAEQDLEKARIGEAREDLARAVATLATLGDGLPPSALEAILRNGPGDDKPRRYTMREYFDRLLRHGFY